MAADVPRQLPAHVLHRIACMILIVLLTDISSSQVTPSTNPPPNLSIYQSANVPVKVNARWCFSALFFRCAMDLHTL